MSDLALYQALAPLFEQLRRDIVTARDDIAAVVTELGKAKTEILSRIADLEAAIDAGVVTAADLQPLRDAAEALDAIVPDQPEPPAP